MQCLKTKMFAERGGVFFPKNEHFWKRIFSKNIFVLKLPLWKVLCEFFTGALQISNKSFLIAGIPQMQCTVTSN